MSQVVVEDRRPKTEDRRPKMGHLADRILNIWAMTDNSLDLILFLLRILRVVWGVCLLRLEKFSTLKQQPRFLAES